jgi:hypothetical protein
MPTESDVRALQSRVVHLEKAVGELAAAVEDLADEFRAGKSPGAAPKAGQTSHTARAIANKYR